MTEVEGPASDRCERPRILDQPPQNARPAFGGLVEEDVTAVIGVRERLGGQLAVLEPSDSPGTSNSPITHRRMRRNLEWFLRWLRP